MSADGLNRTVQKDGMRFRIFCLAGPGDDKWQSTIFVVVIGEARDRNYSSL